MAECISCGQPTDGTICHREATKLADTLRTAADLWPELQLTIAKQTRHGDPTPRAGHPAPAAPVRPDGDPATDQVPGWPTGLVVDLRAADVAAAVRSTVHTWARDIAAAVGADLPDTIPEVMRWLASRVEWIRHQPQAGKALDELNDACAQVIRAIDTPVQRYPLGECGAPTEHGPCQHWLSTWPGATTARCGGCGTRHDVTARRGRLLELARDRRGTAAEVARWLTWLGIPTTPAVVRGLAYRGRITADAWGRYRLGDVEAIRKQASAKGSSVSRPVASANARL